MELLPQDITNIILLKYLHLNDKDTVNKLLTLSDISTNVKSVLLNPNFYIRINNLLYKRYFGEFSNDMFNDIFQKDTNNILVNFSINKIINGVLKEIYYHMPDSSGTRYSIDSKYTTILFKFEKIFDLLYKNRMISNSDVKLMIYKNNNNYIVRVKIFQKGIRRSSKCLGFPQFTQGEIIKLLLN
jgi:hypothetical protein